MRKPPIQRVGSPVRNIFNSAIWFCGVAPHLHVFRPKEATTRAGSDDRAISNNDKRWMIHRRFNEGSDVDVIDIQQT